MSLSEGRRITMAELFGLLASLTSLISTGSKISTQFCQFIDSFRTAPQNAKTLAHELQEFCSTLDSLWRVFSGRQPRESDPLLYLQNVLDSCDERFRELAKFAKAHVVREGDRAVSRQMKRWRWAFQEKEVAALKDQLETHKETLSIALLLSTHRESTSVKGGAAQVRERIRELDNRLLQDGDKAKSDTAYASSDVLRRYLECCSRSSVLTARLSSIPVYQKRVSSLLSRVAEDGIQPPYPRSKSTPPLNTNKRLGEDIIRSPSATSMRPARYGSGRNLRRRHSGVLQTPQPENAKRNSDPKLQLREKSHNGRAIEMMGIQKMRNPEVREVRPTTDRMWADLRSLVDQNLPHEILSEQLHQAQLRLEQSRSGTNKQHSGENPDSIGRSNLPAGREAAERKVTKQQPTKKSNVVKKLEPKGKAKDEKVKIKVQVRLSNPETKKKSGKEKARMKAAAQKAALEERAATERARQAAEYRGLILPGSQAGRLSRNIVSETDLVIERTAEKSKASGDGPNLEKNRPLSNGWAPVSTKMSKAHVCKEILDESRIEYTEELDYFVIHQNVSLTDQISLRFRTNEIRGV